MIKPIGQFRRDDGKKVIIAGPCSAETRQQVLDTAHSLAAMGIGFFRAGIWKPRTRPGCFEGIGSEGLEWLRQVRDETGMSVATEVANPKHVEEALKAEIDILWIGARTTTSPFAVQEIADALRGCDIPLLVKNPVNPDIELWTGAIERFEKAGISRIAAIHRGFSTYGDSIYRNPPQWQIPIELRRRMPELQILCDPSHMSGSRKHLLSLSQTALEMNADGLFIEVHCNPDSALSDASQQLTPAQMASLMEQLKSHRQPDEGEVSELLDFRSGIDGCDHELMRILIRRMEISREIGEYKKKHNLTVLQSERYNEIIRKLQDDGTRFGLSGDFIRSLFETIHAESIRIQLADEEDK